MAWLTPDEEPSSKPCVLQNLIMHCINDEKTLTSFSYDLLNSMLYSIY